MVAITQLVIGRRQFFVDGLQLFLGGLEFLVGALEFLVARQQFFLACSQVFPCSFMFLEHRQQMPMAALEFGVQPRDFKVLVTGNSVARSSLDLSQSLRDDACQRSALRPGR